jgi:hypothetical protein
MNTDSEGRTPVLLCFALGHCPVRGFSPWKSAVLSGSYLCLSVSICGCIELLRLSRGIGARGCARWPAHAGGGQAWKRRQFEGRRGCETAPLPPGSNFELANALLLV